MITSFGGKRIYPIGIGTWGMVPETRQNIDRQLRVMNTVNYDGKLIAEALAAAKKEAVERKDMHQINLLLRLDSVAEVAELLMRWHSNSSRLSKFLNGLSGPRIEKTNQLVDFVMKDPSTFLQWFLVVGSDRGITVTYDGTERTPLVYDYQRANAEIVPDSLLRHVPMHVLPK